MDQKLIDSRRAIPRQKKIHVDAEIRQLSLDELGQVAGSKGRLTDDEISAVVKYVHTTK